MKNLLNLKGNLLTGYIKYVLMAFMLLTISACGGGGSGGGGGGDGTIGTGIYGTAATGAAIANTTITVKSKTGVVKTTTSDANGKFEIKDLADDGPYLLRIDKGNGEFLYSVAHKSDSSRINRNIHPYTDLIIRNWFESQGQDISSAFTGSTAIANMPSEQSINDVKDALYSIVKQVLASNSVTEEIDLLSTPFDTDRTGFDAFLDNAPVIINNNQITIIINNPIRNVQNIIINNVDLSTDFTATADSLPSTPENVRALPASATEILVVWNASTDDKGVAGYNIYRNGSLVGTTPYTVFSDTGLVAGTNYSYEVEAIDGFPQISAKSDATLDVTLDTLDTTVPPTPTGLVVTANDNVISLSWTASQINDVASFEVLTGATGSVTTRIATLTTTAYNHSNVASATEYCYRIKAVDAAGNASSLSEQMCATTGGVIADTATLQFSSATYQVSENASSITITVNRAGDISQAVSVNYRAEGNTAVDGEDFSAIADTTLNWAANDSSAKTFAVQIMSDNIAESNETVALTLSNPSNNAEVGTNATAVLTITDVTAGVCSAELTMGSISEDTVLSEPCYKVLNNLEVKNPAKLTISPGVKLEFAAGTQLHIRKGASLYAVGTANAPILFTAKDPTPGYWDGIMFRYSNSTNNQLDYVTIEYGVNNLDTIAFPSDPVRLSVKNSTFRSASKFGVNVYSNSVILDAFESNTLTLNDTPISLPANMVEKLGKNSRYSGNTEDRIVIKDGDIVTEQTWKEIGVPYYIHRSVDVEAALILEAGVSLIFNSSTQLQVTKSGSLNAIGTVAKPILFTGLNKTPGYWKGIMFRFSNSASNQLDYVTVEYAGIGNSDSGNISSVCFPQNPIQFSVTNSTIKDSFNWGVYQYGTESYGCNITLENNIYINNRGGDVNEPTR